MCLPPLSLPQIIVLYHVASTDCYVSMSSKHTYAACALNMTESGSTTKAKQVTCLNYNLMLLSKENVRWL